MRLNIVLFLSYLVGLATALSAAEWRNQSVYFVMTDRFAHADGSLDAPCNVSNIEYCGGTWKGIENKLDYIQGMGFTAIWITPITHQIQTSAAYHGYWQDDLYDINPEYGTKQDLLDLSGALHDRGMYLMVDVVANHFAWTGPPESVNYSSYVPFDDKKYFHPVLKPDYGPPQNQTSVEIGWLVSDPSPVVLPDVNTSRSDVRELYYSWIGELVQNYSIDALRIDTVKHVEQSFWPGFANASGVFTIGEVFETVNYTYLCDYQNYLDSVLDYGPYTEIHAAFSNASGNMYALANRVKEVQSSCRDPTVLGSFMENHDNPRFPNATDDIVLTANAITFTMLADGFPIIYYGQEQFDTGGQDPYNRAPAWKVGAYDTSAPLYQLISKLNAVRTTALTVADSYLTSLNTPIYADENTLVMRRGDDGAAVIAILSNLGTDNATDYTLHLPAQYTGYEVGTNLTDVVSCDELAVGSNGLISVPMSKGAPKVLFATDQLDGVCG